MSNIKEQLTKSPYPANYMMHDRQDAWMFLYGCFKRILAGEIAADQMQMFAAQSMAGSLSMTQNETTDKEIFNAKSPGGK